jgi:hypothetical protein
MQLRVTSRQVEDVGERLEKADEDEANRLRTELAYLQERLDQASCSPPPPHARAVEIRSETLRFDAGTSATTVSGRIEGDAIVYYQLHARVSDAAGAGGSTRPSSCWA